MKKSLTYKKSGVDIHKANQFVRSISGLVKATAREGVLKAKSGFGGHFVLPAKYKKPVLVSSTDGVGTKLILAQELDKHDTVGIDLVAMNVNDILCSGAEPLFFLDYIACGKVKPHILKSVVRGIADGCRQAGCSLVGGETAEMPGMYNPDEYDLAGFTVGVVEKSKNIDGKAIRSGDRLIGLASSGLHSNGFSLARKVFSAQERRKFSKELLAPTRIYVKPVLALIRQIKVKGIAHITGGAFYEKLTKIVPPGKCFHIQKGAWPVPKIFQEIQKRGHVADKEMFTTFNMGIGMVVAVAARDAVRTIQVLKKNGVRSWDIGEVISDKNRRILL